MEINSFLQYDKISDTLMHFDRSISLKFVLTLSKKTKDGSRIPFHSEYSYLNQSTGKNGLSIKRNITCGFVIDDSKNFENSIMLRPHDVLLLIMVIENNIMPWFIGNKRIFGFNDEKQLIIKGKYDKIDFPISDYKYISFYPLVLAYSDNTSKEGIRMVINSQDNILDMDINKFMEFAYYIKSTDMYNAAIGLLNYIKMAPYGENLSDMNSGYSYGPSADEWNTERNNTSGPSFFDKL